MLEAVRDGGAVARRDDRLSRCSPGGGTRSACSTSRSRLLGSDAVTALHVNYGLRDDSDADEAHCARALRAARGAARGRAPAASRGARQPAGLGAGHPLRGGGSAGAAADGARSPPATPPTTRSRRSSTGSPPRPAAGRCWGCAPRDGQAGAAAARLHPRADHRLLRGAGAGLARRPDQRRDRPTRATASATACCRRWRRSTRPRPRNVLRTAELLRDEAEVLDALVDCRARRSATGLAGPRSSSSGWPSCRRRCAGSSCSDWPTAPPAVRCQARPATPTRSRRCVAPAPRCSTWAAASAPSSSAASFARSAEPPADGTKSSRSPRISSRRRRRI